MLFRHLVQHQSPVKLSSSVTRLVSARGRAPSHWGRWRVAARGHGTVAVVKEERVSGAATTSTTTPHPNAGIIEMLQLEKQEEERQLHPNTFKVNAFANAIEAIKQIRVTIESGDDYALEQVKGVGQGIKSRINQHFIQLALDAARSEEEEQAALMRRAIIELQKIPGIGRVKAKALAEAGCWSLAELVSSDKHHHLLSPQQIICLRYIDHLDRPMSRADAERVWEACCAALPGQYEVVLAGEYRRGLDEISTLVVVVLHPDCVHVPMPLDPPPVSALPPSIPASSSATTTTATSTATSPEPLTTEETTPPKPTTKRHRTVLKKIERTTSLTKATRKASLLHNEVIPTLRKADVMCETISETVNTWVGVVSVPVSSPAVRLSLDEALVDTSERGEEHGRETERGEEEQEVNERVGSSVALALQTPVGSRYRRVAFHLIPQKSEATALLALTGDDELNRHMRRKAEKMGMLLNEYGLWKWNARSPAQGGSSLEEAMGETRTPLPVEGKGGESEPEGSWGLVKTPTEADVFKALGMGFVKPEKRNWGFVSGSTKMRPSRKKFSTSFLGS